MLRALERLILPLDVRLDLQDGLRRRARQLDWRADSAKRQGDEAEGAKLGRYADTLRRKADRLA